MDSHDRRLCLCSTKIGREIQSHRMIIESSAQSVDFRSWINQYRDKWQFLVDHLLVAFLVLLYCSAIFSVWR